MLFGSDDVLITKEYNYGTNILDNTNIKPVVVEDEITSNVISSPIDEGMAEISIHYYNKNDDETRQQNSLIYYEYTYLPNTGILYTSNESFEVKTVYMGKVTEILEDEFFGKCIVIEHENNISGIFFVKKFWFKS